MQFHHRFRFTCNHSQLFAVLSVACVLVSSCSSESMEISSDTDGITSTESPLINEVPITINEDTAPAELSLEEPPLLEPTFLEPPPLFDAGMLQIPADLFP